MLKRPKKNIHNMEGAEVRWWGKETEKQNEKNKKSKIGKLK